MEIVGEAKQWQELMRKLDEINSNVLKLREELRGRREAEPKRELAVTDEQRRLLTKFGVSVPANFSRERASALIDALIKRR